MGEKTDEAKGRAKEAIGDLTDDERLKREGTIDRASGAAKGVANDAEDKIQEGIDAAKRKARELNDR